jgi:hypothetical protein
MTFLNLTSRKYLGLNYFLHHVIYCEYLYNSNFLGFDKCQE